MAYVGYASWLIYDFHQNQKQLNPNPKAIAIRWIVELFIGVVLIMLIGIRGDVLHTETLFNTLVIGLFLIINLIGFRGVLHQNSFMGVSENVALAALDIKEKYVNRPLNTNELEAHAFTIKNVIEIDKLHLDQNLTLSSFADYVYLSPRVISQVINQFYGKNFSDYINEHRLEYAKKLLTNYTNAQKNISEIIDESGFSSKTRFYSFFKKHTKLSPKVFREINSPS